MQSTRPATTMVGTLRDGQNPSPVQPIVSSRRGFVTMS